MRITKYAVSQTDAKVTLVHYQRENPRDDARPMPAVLILPGGGFGSLAYRESEPVALKFLAEGFQAFVLNYSLIEAGVDKGNVIELGLQQVAASVKRILDNHEAWNIDPDRLFLIGFSAGGLLATLYSNRYKAFGQPKLRGVLLCYPVTGLELGWPPSLDLFPFEIEDVEAYHTCYLVDEHTPDTFIWHTTEDQGVPVINSLEYCEALAAMEIPFEAHLFEKGPHGISLASKAAVPVDEIVIPDTAKWFSLALDWLQRRL